MVPDTAVNAFKRAEVEGIQPVVKGLHETDVQIRIHGERVGTLEFAWCEEELAEPELGAGIIEVEVKTVGVNFKVGALSLLLCVNHSNGLLIEPALCRMWPRRWASSRRTNLQSDASALALLGAWDQA